LQASRALSLNRQCRLNSSASDLDLSGWNALLNSAALWYTGMGWSEKSSSPNKTELEDFALPAVQRLVDKGALKAFLS
jgi:hypothetical protein